MDNFTEMNGSAWMFYNHYNPDLLKAVSKILQGSSIEDQVEALLNEESEPGQE